MGSALLDEFIAVLVALLIGAQSMGDHRGEHTLQIFRSHVIPTVDQRPGSCAT